MADGPTLPVTFRVDGRLFSKPDSFALGYPPEKAESEYNRLCPPNARVMLDGEALKGGEKSEPVVTLEADFNTDGTPDQIAVYSLKEERNPSGADGPGFVLDLYGWDGRLRKGDRVPQNDPDDPDDRPNHLATIDLSRSSYNLSNAGRTGIGFCTADANGDGFTDLLFHQSFVGKRHYDEGSDNITLLEPTVLFNRAQERWRGYMGREQDNYYSYERESLKAFRDDWEDLLRRLGAYYERYGKRVKAYLIEKVEDKTSFPDWQLYFRVEGEEHRVSEFHDPYFSYNRARLTNHRDPEEFLHELLFEREWALLARFGTFIPYLFQAPVLLSADFLFDYGIPLGDRYHDQDSHVWRGVLALSAGFRDSR